MERVTWPIGSQWDLIAIFKALEVLLQNEERDMDMCCPTKFVVVEDFMGIKLREALGGEDTWYTVEYPTHEVSEVEVRRATEDEIEEYTLDAAGWAS